MHSSRLNIADAASGLDLKELAADRALDRGAKIVNLGAQAGVTGADLFISFATMIAAQNPHLARRTMDALEKTIEHRAAFAEGVRQLQTVTGAPQPMALGVPVCDVSGQRCRNQRCDAGACTFGVPTVEEVDR